MINESSVMNSRVDENELELTITNYNDQKETWTLDWMRRYDNENEQRLWWLPMKMTLRKNGLWSECEGILAKLVTAQVDQPDDVVAYQSLDSEIVFGSFEIVWTRITHEL